MDMQFHGANCLSITTKQARIVIDDNLADIGKKTVTRANDIVLFTGPHGDPTQQPKIVIDQPGEYEVSGVSIYGIPARAHMDEEGHQSATMFKLAADDLRVLVVGHAYPELSDDQLETIGMIDVMFVPVGGNGYTLDGIGALRLIKKIEPKLIIPTHYDATGFAFPVPQQPLDQALKALAMEPSQKVPKLKAKAGDLGDVAQLVVLDIS